MGISDFLKIIIGGKKFAEYTEFIDRDLIKNKRFAVDALHEIYKAMNAIKEPLTYNGEITSHIKITFEKINRFNKLNMVHIWIFDTKPNPLKAETIKKRKVRLERKHVEQIKMLLSLCGIKWISVDVEAEFYASELFKYGQVDGVISSDMDVVIRGGDLYRETEVNGKSVIQYINNKMFREQTGLSTEQLCRIAVHIGCDFAPKTKGYGPVNAMKKIDTPFTERQQQAYDLLIGPIDMKNAIVEMPNTCYEPDKLIEWLKSLGFHNPKITVPIYKN